MCTIITTVYAMYSTVVPYVATVVTYILIRLHGDRPTTMRQIEAQAP